MTAPTCGEKKGPIQADLTDHQKRCLYRALAAHSGRTLLSHVMPEQQRELTKIIDAVARGIFNELAKTDGTR